MSINMVANHAIRARENDVIFGISARAAAAVNTYGANNVINATMGVLVDDEAKFVAFDTVYDELKSLPNQNIAAYAQIEGDPSFLEAVKEACFMEYMPEGYIRAIATPGGSGAIHHSVCNYTNIGDTVLTGNWFWEPYQTIAHENLRNLDTFNLFNEKNCFNMESYKEKFDYYLNKQGRILTILNTPAHNPTGYTVTDDEWDNIIDLMKEAAKDKDKRITLLVDVAYIDFAGRGRERRKFMKKFSSLPENIMILIAFSASKGYTMYGLRNGALLSITSDKEISEEFFYSSVHSNRGAWSNGTKGAMQVLTNIITNKELNKKFEAERDIYREMLLRRGEAFLKGAKENELPIAPYVDGFFASVPCEDPSKLAEDLIKENLFVVPLRKGIRFALCAVNEEKCYASPKTIRKALK